MPHFTSFTSSPFLCDFGKEVTLEELYIMNYLGVKDNILTGFQEDCVEYQVGWMEHLRMVYEEVRLYEYLGIIRMNG